MKFRARAAEISGSKYIVVEYLLIERHKLLRLLFKLDADEMGADFVRLKNAPDLGDKPG
jgi:hypothetical protein